MTVTPGSRAERVAKVQGVAQADNGESPLQTPDTLARGLCPARPLSVPNGDQSPVGPRLCHGPQASISMRTRAPDPWITRDSAKILWFLSALIKKLYKS